MVVVCDDVLRRNTDETNGTVNCHRNKETHTIEQTKQYSNERQVGKITRRVSCTFC